MKLSLSLLAAAAVLYGVWVLFLWAQQGRMAYPIAGLPAAPARPPRDAIVAWLAAGEARVETWFLPARGAAAERSPAVLYGHGNAETIDDLPAALLPLREMGLAVLLVEYPGYGRSTGTPSEASIGAAFAAAFDLLAARPDVDAKRIVVFGQSLGGGAVSTLLPRRPVAAAILLSTFSSARVFARRYLAPGFLVRDVFDNEAAVAGYGGPVLVLHGRADSVVPFANGERLARSARNGRLRAYDCDHWCLDGRAPVWSDVATFLTESGVLAGPASPGG